jgi:hypothetical protein
VGTQHNTIAGGFSRRCAGGFAIALTSSEISTSLPLAEVNVDEVISMPVTESGIRSLIYVMTTFDE